MVEVVSVTSKGQATIPKRLRQKYGIKKKVLVEEDERGILLRPVPSPSDDLGSLKPIFKGKTSRELLKEARKEEFKREEELMKYANTGSIRL